MEGSQNDVLNSQPISKNVQEETKVYEDEINLIDYFRVLWKQKWFIFLASVLPALVVGLAVFLSPRDYKITYTYNMGLGEKAFKVLEDTFYSTENLEKLVGKLQEGGFDGYATKLAETKTTKDLKKIVSFEILPSYSEAKNLDEIEVSGGEGFSFNYARGGKIWRKYPGNILSLQKKLRTGHTSIFRERATERQDYEP